MLADGVHRTVDEEHMWSSMMPEPPNCLEVGIVLPKHNFKLSAIKIWNYNKSLLESIKGFKEVEILFDEKLIYDGIVRRGTGNEHEEYCTQIVLPGYENLYKGNSK